MNSFLIVSITCLIIIIFLLVFVAISPDIHEENVNQFINDDGDHIYYDRHLIRHKEYLKQHSENTENKNCRKCT